MQELVEVVMNRVQSRRIAHALAIVSISFLAGCGSNNNNVAPPAPPVAPVPGAVAPGGCLPLTAQIPFTATNIQFDSFVIIGGQIPPPYGTGQAIGTIALGGAVTAGAYQGTGPDGTLSMTITPLAPAVAPGTYPYPPYGTFPGSTGALANGTGVVTIAAATQQDIIFQTTGMLGGNPYNPLPGVYPYPYAPGTAPVTPTAATTCVSGIAIQGGHKDYYIYGTSVFLYLNNTQHGYKLYI